MPNELTVKIAWASTAFDTTPTYTDETTRCLAVQGAVRGASTDAGGIEPGTIRLLMKNDDRRFEQYYTGSTLYPNVRHRKQVQVLYGANPVWNGWIDTFDLTYPTNGKTAVCTITCIDLAGLANQTPAPSIVADVTRSYGPTHYYRCKERLFESMPAGVYGQAADDSGNGNHATYNGTIVGAIRYGVQGPSIAERAFEVAYSTPPSDLAYLEIPAYAHSTGNATLQFWFAANITANRVVVNQADAVGGRHFAVQVRTDGKIDLQDTTGAIVTSTNTTLINDGSWHMLSFTRAGGVLFFALDNVAAGNWAWATPMLNQTYPVTFGRVVGTALSNIVIYQSEPAGQKLATFSAMRGELYFELETRFDYLLAECGFPAGYRAFFEIPDLLPLDYDDETTTLLAALNQLSESEGVPLVVHYLNGFGQYPRDLGFGGHPQSSTSQMTFNVGDYQDLRLLSDAQDRASTVRVQRYNGGAWAEATSGSDPLGHAPIKVETVVDVSQAELQAYADWVAACADPDRLRVGEILVEMGTKNASTLDLLDRITVNWQPPGGGAQISEETLVTGLTWNSVSGGGVWCTIRCNPKWLVAAP